ncbi:MAG: hypothetical protein LC785_14310 [Acidobacteria bacterium]|nr:hypothetical protein [Acidobacteriota bacterium]
MRPYGKWKPLLAGLIATPICLLVAAVSGGVGHGDYTLAIILFPFAALFIVAFDQLPSATIIMIILASLQLPAYGTFISLYAVKMKRLVASVSLLILHLLAVFVALWAGE